MDTLFMTKMATKWPKLIPYLRPKRLKNPILWGRTYLYSPYKGLPSPGEAIWTLNFYGWEGSWSNTLKCDRTVGFVNLFGSLAFSDDHSFYWFRSNPHVHGS